MNIDEELGMNPGEKKNRFVIIGIPERIITDNKISYKIPVKLYSEDNSIKEKTTHITVSEEDMISMLKMAKEMFADEEINKSYV